MNEDDDPPEDFTGPYAADAPHHDLWRRARAWVEDLFRLADDLPHLARTGVTRAFGRRLGQFVFSVEAAIRRLVLALALQLTPALADSTPKPARSRRIAAPVAAAPAPEGPKLIRVRFHLFALRGAGRSGPSAATTAPTSTRGPVFSFARDPLLAAGPAPPSRKRQRGRSAWRTRETPQAHAFSDTLCRRTRASDEMNDLSSGFFRRPEPRPRGTHNPPMLRQDRPIAVPQGLPHDHLIPAPALACRIAALWNVIHDPMAFATRAAQRLARLAGGIETLRSAPEPKPPSTRGDKREAPALSLLWRTHSLFLGLDDTS